MLPYHRELDAAREAALGKNKIGTTKRGIGPTYADKANRIGLRLADMLDEATARELIEIRLNEANPTLEKYDLPTFTVDQVWQEVSPAIERLRPHITNVIPALHKAWKDGKIILFEGAQGSFLDVDFGTYPFVTSSNTTSGGACTGSGLPPPRLIALLVSAKPTPHGSAQVLSSPKMMTSQPTSTPAAWNLAPLLAVPAAVAGSIWC